MAENTKTDELQNTRHLLLDHFANSMPVPVDRHYAEYLLGQVIAEEDHKALDRLEEESYDLPMSAGNNIPIVMVSSIQTERNKYPLNEETNQ